MFLFQTCYEMERYLKDEPKMKSYKKLSSSDRTWYEVNCIDDFTDRHYDALSSGSSPCSWDGALSCAILVKQEPLDIMDDEDDDSSSFESPVHSDVQLRLVARNSGTLTPPSSPESGQGGHSNESSGGASDLDVCGLRISNGHRNTIVRVRASGLTRYISVVPRPQISNNSISSSTTTTKHHTRLDHSPDSKRRIHKCQFLGCKKVYTKSSHLKAHQRTHTGWYT